MLKSVNSQGQIGLQINSSKMNWNKYDERIQNDEKGIGQLKAMLPIFRDVMDQLWCDQVVIVIVIGEIIRGTPRRSDYSLTRIVFLGVSLWRDCWKKRTRFVIADDSVINLNERNRYGRAGTKLTATRTDGVWSAERTAQHFIKNNNNNGDGGRGAGSSKAMVARGGEGRTTYCGGGRV